ncbi:MAG: sigma-54-dependent Fis family transcriptional regulator, partial [Candidatus Methylomirabilis oxyfera]|nr:sigma-54-dependent Fis family transcriptional regulator [Candidatus Methylomirabilis oxyfera]
ISNGAMRLLLNFHSPGNVRQLEAVIERAILLSEGPEIQHYDLPIEVRFFDLPVAPTPSSVPGSKFAIEIPEQGIQFEALERDLILQAMERSDWVITKAARLLGLSYRTLQYRLEKFQIKRDTKAASITPESGSTEQAEQRKGGM